MAVTYGMTTPIMSSVMPNPMTVPVMSTVMPNPMTTTTVVSSMGVQGLPMSNALPIIVNENTPNLAEIQSFPVIVSGGGIHMHQDPVSGQRYRMNDEFHSRIPQILADRELSSGQNVSSNTYVDEYLQSYITKYESDRPITSAFSLTAIGESYTPEPTMITNTVSDSTIVDMNYSEYSDTPIVIQNELYSSTNGNYTQTKIFENGIPV